MKTIPIAPLHISYILNSEINCRNVDDIPIKTQPSKTLYQNMRTFTLKKSHKIDINTNNTIPGVASLSRFNPQDLGLPK